MWGTQGSACTGEGAVYRQTRDMSLAQRVWSRRKIAKDELMQHEERNNLYAYLGQKNFKTVVSKKIKLAETDMIALYTRGNLGECRRGGTG